MLSGKFDVVVTNPPYMGGSGMDAKLSKYVKDNYPDSKSDLFAVFIERCKEMTAVNRFQAMITQHAWMFLSSYEKLRGKLLSVDTINMAHLGARAFEEIGGEVVQTTSFVMQKRHIKKFKGTYCRLIEPTTQQGKEDMFLAGENRYEAQQANFAKIPGSPVAYWVSESILSAFVDGVPIGKLTIARNGMKTGNNDKFIKLWWEINSSGVMLDAEDALMASASGKKWFPYNKGGGFRKWYGNNDYVVNWENSGHEIFKNAKSDGRNVQDYPLELKFKPVITWSSITSSQPSFRYKKYHISDIAGMSLYNCGDSIFQYLAFCNTKVTANILSIIAPTMNFQAGDIARLPLLSGDESNRVDAIIQYNIGISCADWDSYETSWDFKKHPLV